MKVEISDSSLAYQSYLKQVTLTLRHFLITLQLSTKGRETSIVGLADLRGQPRNRQAEGWPLRLTSIGFFKRLGCQ